MTNDTKTSVKINKSLFLEDWDMQALVDNELDWEDEKYVRNLMKFDPKSEKRYRELQHQKRLINLYWQDKNSRH
jgi:hypothetical protein